MAEVWDSLKAVRLKLMDPQGIINLDHAATYAALPIAPYSQYGYRDDATGIYYRRDVALSTWEALSLRIADETLNDLIDEYGIKGAVKHAIPPIMAVVLNEMSIVQLSSGTETTQYQSIASIYQFYKGLQAMYAEEAEEEVGYSTGRMIHTRKPVIGGVHEW